ncbi:hypothetical protein ACERII_18310 [Evansella sp. AB-rgal1]|uniref:hypothetical protein n=1 Tax=Evansella sp. AB-rgal1 TaxID=3242696 RepID=UPI00359D6075
MATGIESPHQFPKEREEGGNGNRKSTSIPEGAERRWQRESKAHFNSRRSEKKVATGIESPHQFPKERKEGSNGNRKFTSIPEGARRRWQRELKVHINSRRSEKKVAMGIESPLQFPKERKEGGKGNRKSTSIPEGVGRR